MATVSRVKHSGGKIAPRSDLRVGATLGTVVFSRSQGAVVGLPRPPSVRFSEPPVTRPWTRSVTRARAIADASRPCPVSDSVLGPTRGGQRPPVLGLRAVSVRLCRLPREILDSYTRSSSATECLDSTAPRDSSAIATSPPSRLEPRVVPVAGTGTTGVRILQLNMRRAAAVSGEVRQLQAEKRLDVLLLQEPYVRKQGRSHTFYGLGTGMRVAAVRSQKPWAAVAVSNPEFQLLFVSQLSTAHCVCAEVQAPGFSFYVVSHYFQWADEMEKHLSHLDKVLRTLRGKRLLVALDSNARSSLWGPQGTDAKGARLESLIRAFDLRVVNDPSQPPTFWTTRGSSYIDVTLVSPSMSSFVSDWRVRGDWSTSDHQAIDIRLRAPKAKGAEGGPGTSRFDTRRADWDQFSRILADLSGSRLEGLGLGSAEEVERMAGTLTDVLTDACSASMPRKRFYRRSNPWWTARLTRLKKAAYRLRRAFQREEDGPERLKLLRHYRLSLRKYSREVRRAKIESWRKFVTSHGNSNPWGYVYKHQANKLRVDRVLSTLRRGDCSTMTVRETASYLLDAHIPDDRPEDDTPAQKGVRTGASLAPGTDDAPQFSVAEVAAALRSSKNGKAPGPDLIEVSVLKKAFAVIPDQLTRLFNGCLLWGVFPSNWKLGSLRVLLKGEDKDEKDPKSYRPICLLSVIGKTFEKLLKERLASTALAPGKISGRQYGFVSGRSAEDAIVELRRMVDASEKRYAMALLFDISGAFDNVWWPLVLDALRERSCPKNVFEVLQSYFDDRRVKIAFGREEVSKRATRGCPQGSVLGPACWNLMFDGLLRTLETAVGQNFVAYADDLLVLVRGESRRELEVEGQRVVDLILEWCSSAKLQISQSKTEGIVLRADAIKRQPIGRRGGARPDRRRKTAAGKKPDLLNRNPTVRLGDAKLNFKKSVRYLGVHFDRGMGVGTHCQRLSDKVGSLFDRMGRLAGGKWGLRHGALSVVYRGVFVPTVAYAAAGWADLCKDGERRALRSLQRRALIAVTSAYRTASWESLCVVAGVAPVDLQLAQSRALYRLKKGRDAEVGGVGVSASSEDPARVAKEETLKLWQARWTSSHKGRTTHAFFPSIRDRLRAGWVHPTFHSTQALTGHGDFKSHLARLGLVPVGDTGCSCGGQDTGEHFLIECPKYDPQRVALREYSKQVGWPRAARLAVSSQEAFSAFASFCRESLWLKGFDSRS